MTNVRINQTPLELRTRWHSGILLFQTELEIPVELGCVVREYGVHRRVSHTPPRVWLDSHPVACFQCPGTLAQLSRPAEATSTGHPKPDVVL